MIWCYKNKCQSWLIRSSPVRLSCEPFPSDTAWQHLSWLRLTHAGSWHLRVFQMLLCPDSLISRRTHCTSGSEQKSTQESRLFFLLIANAAPVTAERVSTPNREWCYPGGQTLDPWSPAEICLGIIRPFKSLCVPEWAHRELYRLICSYSQPRGTFTDVCTMEKSYFLHVHTFISSSKYKRYNETSHFP